MSTLLVKLVAMILTLGVKLLILPLSRYSLFSFISACLTFFLINADDHCGFFLINYHSHEFFFHIYLIFQ